MSAKKTRHQVKIFKLGGKTIFKETLFLKISKIEPSRMKEIRSWSNLKTLMLIKSEKSLMISDVNNLIIRIH